jgi:hypothetical protein
VIHICKSRHGFASHRPQQVLRPLSTGVCAILTAIGRLFLLEAPSDGRRAIVE